MSLRRWRGAALFLATIFLQAGCVSIDESILPADAPGADTRASRPKELPPDKTAELCQAAGEELEKQGLFADATAQYEKARQTDPHRNPVVCRRLAVLYDRLGDDAHALAEYQLSVAAAPHDADLLNDFGYFHYQRGDLAEAEKCFRQALEANPKHLRATVNLGLTLGKQGRIDASLEAFRRVLPDSQALCNIGILLAQQGKIAEGQHALEESLRLEPGLKQARVVLDHLSDAVLTPAAPAPPSDAATAPAPAPAWAPAPPPAPVWAATAPPPAPTPPPSPTPAPTPAPAPPRAAVPPPAASVAIVVVPPPPRAAIPPPAPTPPPAPPRATAPPPRTFIPTVTIQSVETDDPSY